MEIFQIIKRDYETSNFVLNKITNAIEKAMQSVGVGTRNDAEDISGNVYNKLLQQKNNELNYTPTVEQVQDIVEEQLMESSFPNVAKAYILYRNEQARRRKTDVFEKRINFKPFEYPQLYEYVNAIRHSYWIHTEFNYTSDIQDFKTGLNEVEKSAIKNAMLAISQIEVAVKTFWGDVVHKMPKPEIGAVGATFSESEVRHHDAYSHLLEVLGLNSEFKELKKKPVMMERVHYLETALRNSKSDDNQDYSESIVLFSLFIEHVSLFSQFLIIMAFNKHKNVLKGISNVVEATSKEEQIHGDFGIDLIKILRDEKPEWFGTEYKKVTTEMSIKAFESESKIVDWIFEKGELDFLPKNVVKEFLKNRFNRSLVSIGLDAIFPVDEVLLKETEWFDDEIIGTKHGDFFVKRSIAYTKRSKSITYEDLF